MGLSITKHMAMGKGRIGARAGLGHGHEREHWCHEQVLKRTGAGTRPRPKMLQGQEYEEEQTQEQQQEPGHQHEQDGDEKQEQPQDAATQKRHPATAAP